MKDDKLINEKIIEKFPGKNINALPRVIKIVVNVGAGKVTQDPKYIEKISQDFSNVTGQKPIKTRARQSISGFKIRSGMDVGIKATLRGKRMKDFLNRLINIVLPRIRDFRGIKRSAVTQGGTINIGIKEHIVFPEIKHDDVEKVFGMQINIVTTAKNKADAIKLLSAYGMVFEKK